MENINLNTLTISLEEWKKMQYDLSLAKERIAAKEEVIKSKDEKITNLLSENRKLLEKLEEATTYVYVNFNNYVYGKSLENGVKLSKTSPELEKIINSSVTEATANKLKDNANEIKVLKDKIEDLKYENNRRLKSITTSYQEQIEEITKQYNDLKLDKAAGMVELERLEEVKRLQEEIEYLKSDAKDFQWPRNIIVRLFKNIIIEESDRRFNHLMLKQRMKARDVNSTSAIGSAKNYLKTLEPINSTEFYW